MSSTHYEFSFLSTIGGQKTRLLAATEYQDTALHESLTDTLEELESGTLGESGIPTTKWGIWCSSLRSVRPLILRSTLWQCVAISGMVVSLFATKRALQVDQGVALTFLFCLTFLVADVAKYIIHYFDMPRRAQLARGVQLHLFSRINRKLLVVDPASRGEFSSGNVKTLVSGDVEAVEDFITAASQSWTPAILTVLLTTPAILYLTGTLGAIGIGITLLQLPLAVFAARYVERFKERRQGEQDRLTTVIGEWVKNIRLVRYLHREGAVAKEISIILRRFSFESIKALFVVLLAFAVTYSWWMVPILGMVVSSVYLAIPLDTTTFFPTLWLLSLLSNQVQFIPHSLTQYGSAAAGVSRLEKFFNLPEISRFLRNTDRTQEDGYREHDVSADPPVRLKCKGLSLTYGDSTALSDLNLTIDLTQRTAIVGEVGSGKSSFLNLISGEIGPSAGEIEVQFASGMQGNIWCEEIRSQWRSYFSYSSQEPFLSNASLRSNIDLIGSRSDEEVASAVVSAELVSDISSFEGGKDQEVGETGINLSGGQRQRVSLARAFLSKRPLMLLDDPLSAVDESTEEKLLSSFCRGSSGIILVSHRLNHLHSFDRVIVFSEGKIVEDGSPAILANAPESEFRKLLLARQSGLPLSNVSDTNGGGL